MELSERKKKILAAVTDAYIETAEPVGSKSLVPLLGLSSATIRNEMAELTTLGYLEQPHTSAGRIPSPAGYRLYVNELMREQKLSLEETEAINRTLTSKIQQLDKLMGDVGVLTSHLTSYPALALAAPTPVRIKRFDIIYIDANSFIIVVLLDNNTVKNKLVHLPVSVEQGMIQKLSTIVNANFTGITEGEMTPQLINATERAVGDGFGLVPVIVSFAIETLTEAARGEAVVAGASMLLHQPEYRDPDKAQELLSFLSDGSKLMELPELEGGDSVKVLIGPENVAEELKDSSVVVASYDAGGGMQGLIGVVGPTRMDYSKVAARLSYIAAGLSRLLGSADTPSGFGKLIVKGDLLDEHKQEETGK